MDILEPFSPCESSAGWLELAIESLRQQGHTVAGWAIRGSQPVFSVDGRYIDSADVFRLAGLQI